MLLLMLFELLIIKPRLLLLTLVLFYPALSLISNHKKERIINHKDKDQQRIDQEKRREIIRKRAVQ